MQAGPLPSKVGELGYDGDTPSHSAFVNAITMPARHPADRDGGEESEANAIIQLSPVNNEDTKPQQAHKGIFGIRTLTIVLLAIQILILGGTGVGWFFVIRVLNKSPNASSITSNDGLGSNTTIIFVHVAFAVVSLVQLIFLERRIYCIRAERYAYTHNGEILHTTTMAQNGPHNLSVAFAPWNRPPLPTYASVLIHSGVSTGDVEDNAIAIVPPPAYNNPAKTKMLMQGHLRDSLRLQRPVSVHSQNSVNLYEAPRYVR